VAVLFITHDLGVVAKICDEIAVMYAGRIVEKAPATELVTKPAHPYTQALMKCLPSLDKNVPRLPSIAGAPPQLMQLPPGAASGRAVGRSPKGANRNTPARSP